MNMRMRVQLPRGVTMTMRVNQVGPAQEFAVVQHFARSCFRDQLPRVQNKTTVGDIFEVPKIVRGG
jgi:hypothetical protein